MYCIPKKVARPWVEGDELLLLLDGLDEVAQDWRGDCVRAINSFRQEHLVPLVVCSRAEEQNALTTRLKLHKAVVLQPLTPEQVEEYLDRASGELVAMREMLQEDETFYELAKMPLMLSVVTMAYQGKSIQALKALGTIEARVATCSRLAWILCLSDGEATNRTCQRRWFDGPRVWRAECLGTTLLCFNLA